MAFKLKRGKTKIMWFEGDTACEIRDGSLVTLTDSATLVYANNVSTDRILGVARRNDTTTDSAQIPVEVPVELGVEWEIDLDSDGGAADTDIGRYVSVDTTGGGSVNAGDSAATRVDISDTTTPLVFVTGRIGTTKITGVLTKLAFIRTFDSLDTTG